MGDHQPLSHLILHKAHNPFPQLLALDNHTLVYPLQRLQTHLPWAALRAVCSLRSRVQTPSPSRWSVQHQFLKIHYCFWSALLSCSLLNHMKGPKHQNWSPALPAFPNQDFTCTHRFPITGSEEMPAATPQLYHHTTTLSQ